MINLAHFTQWFKDWFPRITTAKTRAKRREMLATFLNKLSQDDAEWVQQQISWEDKTGDSDPWATFQVRRIEFLLMLKGPRDTAWAERVYRVIKDRDKLSRMNNGSDKQ